jgi:atypical dual specificity phosphatase
LLQRRKAKLQQTQTKVTGTDGRVTIYENQGTQQTLTATPTSHSSSSHGYGFVVDTKPDLSLGTVLPWLLISSQDVPNEAGVMREVGVTHVLSLLPGFQLNQDQGPTTIKEHLSLELYDEESFRLDSAEVRRGLEFIRSVERTQGAKVLVHCNAGISRAPSVVLLYLIQCKKLSFEDAWALVKGARPGMRPNPGFLAQLRALTE